MVKKYGLFIDVGNTSIKIGLGDKQAIISSIVLPTKISCHENVLGKQILQFVQNTQRTVNTELSIEICIVSSVVPDIDDILFQVCKSSFMLQPLFVHKDIVVPLVNCYEKPKEVGADRLVAAYGARILFPQHRSIVIVDYGTATTFDCIVEDAYLGGLICPGITTSIEALSTSTALLPCITLTKVEGMPIIGRSTDISLRHGFFYSFISMTEGVYTRLCELLPEPVFFIATGGFAFDIAYHTSSINKVYPDLILDGLRFLWKLKSHSLK